MRVVQKAAIATIQPVTNDNTPAAITTGTNAASAHNGGLKVGWNTIINTTSDGIRTINIKNLKDIFSDAS